MTPDLLILHHDLSIPGGAEQLTLMLGESLTQSGAHVEYAACDAPPTVRNVLEEYPRICRLVKILGTWGRLKGLVGILRTFLLLLALLHSRKRYRAVYMDQMAFAAPFIKRWLTHYVIFYCHFPERFLCAQNGSSMIATGYREILASLDEWGMRSVDLLLCNSHFTRLKMCACYGHRNITVLYPSFTWETYRLAVKARDSEWDDAFVKSADCHILGAEHADTVSEIQAGNKRLLVSLNRFDRHKMIERALYAMAELNAREPREDLVLLCCGGLSSADERAYFNQIRALQQKLDGRVQTILLPNCTPEAKHWACQAALACIYTPSNEHFGIVPIEFQIMGKPVIGMESGGLKETVKHGSTGHLVKPNHYVGVLHELDKERLRNSTRADYSAVQFEIGVAHQMADAIELIEERNADAELSFALKETCHKHAMRFSPLAFRSQVEKVVLQRFRSEKFSSVDAALGSKGT